MDGNLSTLIAILVGVLVLTITPAYRNAEIIDRERVHMVNVITQDFTNNVRHKGYINDKMYLEFMNKLDATGLVYNVEITASKKKYYPLRAGDPGYDPATPNYYTYDEKFATNRVLDSIFKGAEHVYKLHAGDSIYISVSNKNLSNYMVLRTFMNSKHNAGIFTQYGGMVLNEDYQG